MGINFKDEIARLNATTRRIVIVALFGLLLASLACLVEDYSTSYYGILLAPGELVNDWIRVLLAATPSLLQVVFGFVAAAQRKRLAAFILGMAWLFDIATDIAYKMQGVDPTFGNVTIVVAYALFVATFFSELMLIFSLQNLGFALGPWWDRARESWAQARKEADRERQKKQKARENGKAAPSILDEAQDMIFARSSNYDGKGLFDN